MVTLESSMKGEKCGEMKGSKAEGKVVNGRGGEKAW
jgi:hypothetical protein